jgi:hypothetical protein
LSNHFEVAPSDSRELDFVPVAAEIPHFSFETIESKDVLDAVKLVKSNAAGNDDIPFIKVMFLFKYHATFRRNSFFVIMDRFIIGVRLRLPQL